jgi:hypothetical protein
MDREDFTSQFTTTGAGSDGTATATSDWEAAIAALDAGELPVQRGEQRVRRLAASIAAGQTWLTGGTTAEHARLSHQARPNFRRTCPAAMSALTAFMAEDTRLPNPATPS